MKKALTIIFSLVMLAVVLAGIAAVIVVHNLQNEPLNVYKPTTFAVKSGDTVNTIANRLHAQNIMDSPAAWAGLARIQGDAKSIQIGEYRLEPGITADELLQKMVSGDVISYKITFIEGKNFKEMRARLAANADIRHTLTGKTDAEVMAALGYSNQHPEGRFFPATYQFARQTTDLEILRLAYNKMQKTLDDVWAERRAGLPYKNAYEALIMASIVEKETGAAFERPQIAGVFVRRLEKGMKLQTDPTVIYGMGDRFDGNIRRRDLREATPYNTYVIKGLPPTPIAMPGKAALEATVNPARGDTLYFVSKGDGTHQFSATLKEHNAAVRKYQLGGN